MSLKPEMILFDFDGVIVDSEIIANQVLADVLTSLGMPTTLDDSFDFYMGRHWPDCLEAIEARWGPALPDLRDQVRAVARPRMEAELQMIPGVADFIESLGKTPRAIASSSQPEWISSRLDHFGFRHHYGDNLFSAAVHVTRGKPHPDIYLHAAAALGGEPEQALVIEDSPLGVRAGVAAGMTVFGLCAGSHIRPGHAEQLWAAGAHEVVTSYADLSGILARVA